MTTKKTTPERAQSSTSARTNRPAWPKGKAEGSKKGTKKGSAEHLKLSPLTPEQKHRIEAEAEAFKQKAHAYAQQAYTAAIEHFEKHHAEPFTLSRLAVVYEESKPGDVHMIVTLPNATN